jgi:pyrroline-5-carboxylate reductase
VQDADVVILSVKPQILPKVMAELKGQIPAEALVLSIVAGVPIVTMQTGLAHDRIVRTMPNTPAQVGKGMTVWVATPAVTAEQKQQAQAILNALGEQVMAEDEHYLDMATGLSGSGPGYVFLLIEAMIDAGVQIGFSRADAQKIVLQTIDGSVELVRSTGLHPAELKNRVTSPAGTTAAGLFELEQSGVRAAILRAVEAAYHRSEALGALYSQKGDQ